jgi:hypothetical protein
MTDEMLHDVYSAAEEGNEALASAVNQQLSEFKAVMAAQRVTAE